MRVPCQAGVQHEADEEYTCREEVSGEVSHAVAGVFFSHVALFQSFWKSREWW